MKIRDNDLSGVVIGSAIRVHSALGPGLLESAYQAALTYELRSQGWEVQSQVILPVKYDGKQIDNGYRIDLLIEKRLIIEIKSVDQIAPIHQAQVLTYLRLSGLKLALLINFNSLLLKDGIRRFIN
ncbi:MAG: GxxExxY protein [Cyclobacteriaceae bacterium]